MQPEVLLIASPRRRNTEGRKSVAHVRDHVGDLNMYSELWARCNVI
jgi:hypothetical protein